MREFIFGAGTTSVFGLITNNFGFSLLVIAISAFILAGLYIKDNR